MMLPSPETIVKINKIFHDLEGADYSNKHEEIFVEELARWKEISSIVLHPANGSRNILDVGTGTGFVPKIFSEYLQCSDRLVCLDLSQAMLDACASNIAEYASKYQQNFFLSDGESLPDEPDCFHIISLNSVLHHLPNPYEYLQKLTRRLVPDGYLIIGHEPNSKHLESVALRMAIRFFRKGPILLWPTKIFGRFFRVLFEGSQRVYAVKKRVNSDEETFVQELNKRFQVAGVDLQISELGEVWRYTDLHDFQVDSSGRMTGGISIDRIVRELENLEVVRFESYWHLQRHERNSKRGKWWGLVLSRLFPRNGATFTSVLRKTR